MNDISREEALAHFGIKGMRWGVRNEPGTGGRASSSKKPRTTTSGETMSKMDVLLANGRGEVAISKAAQWGVSAATAGVSIPVSLVVAAAAKAGIHTLDSGTARVVVNRGNRFLHGETLSYKKNKSLAQKNMSENDIMKKIVPKVNPDYPKIGTNLNCRRCTMVYEMRRRGYDVRATKTIQASSQTNIGINRATGTKLKLKEAGEITSLKSQHPIKDMFIRDKTLTPKTGPDAIFKSLAKQPNRSRGEVAMYWEMGGGHSIAYEMIKGKPVLFDTQSGKQFKNSDEFAKYYKVNIKQAGFTRLDNKPINEAWVERWATNSD